MPGAFVGARRRKGSPGKALEMTVPLWVLLAFAGWTLVTLVGSVGIMRWRRILSGRARLTDFPADEPHGPPVYRRAMRAHANCVENLPVYGAVAVVIAVMGLSAPILDTLALIFMGARVGQTCVHIGLPESQPAVALRFTFFAAQLVCVAWMGIYAANAALA